MLREAGFSPTGTDSSLALKKRANCTLICAATCSHQVPSGSRWQICRVDSGTEAGHTSSVGTLPPLPPTQLDLRPFFSRGNHIEQDSRPSDFSIVLFFSSDSCACAMHRPTVPESAERTRCCCNRLQTVRGRQDGWSRTLHQRSEIRLSNEGLGKQRFDVHVLRPSRATRRPELVHQHSRRSEASQGGVALPGYLAGWRSFCARWAAGLRKSSERRAIRRRLPAPVANREAIGWNGEVALLDEFALFALPGETPACPKDSPKDCRNDCPKGCPPCFCQRLR